MTLSVRAFAETWPAKGAFVISRGAKTEVAVVVAEVSDGVTSGRGGMRPLSAVRRDGRGCPCRDRGSETHRRTERRFGARYQPGAARNALDCALWDLEAKKAGKPAWVLAGLAEPKPVVTCYTLSLGTPESMAEAARAAADMPLLKVKLGGDGDAERIRAVRAAAPERAASSSTPTRPGARRIFPTTCSACAEADVALIEQPLPAGADDFLREVAHAVPICADESVHVAADLDALVGKYDGVNVKLDKAGGLTEALDLVREAKRPRFSRHGRLHARHLARHGAGDAAGAAGGHRRSRRAAASREGPRSGPRLFRRLGLAARTGALGLKPARQAVGEIERGKRDGGRGEERHDRREAEERAGATIATAIIEP